MDMASNESSDALTRIEHRLEALDRKLDERFGAVDVRFEQVDARFEQVDRRFKQVDRRFKQVDRRFEQVDKRFEQVDKRFDQQRSRSQALYEASRSDFNNLYDFVKAFAESTDARFDALDRQLAVKFADVYAAIAASRRA